VVCGAVLLRERRLGTVIMLLGGVMAAGALPLHMRNGLRPEFLEKSGALLFIWTLYILGVTGAFSAILAIRGCGVGGSLRDHRNAVDLATPAVQEFFDRYARSEGQLRLQGGISAARSAFNRTRLSLSSARACVSSSMFSCSVRVRASSA
jgi:hypothetical protein